MSEVTLSSQEWMSVFNIEFGKDILDPDGWDRENLVESVEEPITLDEFVRRVSESTCMLARVDKGIRVGDLLISKGVNDE